MSSWRALVVLCSDDAGVDCFNVCSSHPAFDLASCGRGGTRGALADARALAKKHFPAPIVLCPALDTSFSKNGQSQRTAERPKGVKGKTGCGTGCAKSEA